MQKVASMLGLLVLLAAPSMTLAEEPIAENALSVKARKLLELSGAGALGTQVMAQLLPTLKKMAPEAPESFWNDFMSEVKPETLVELTIPIYVKHFSESELDGLIEFYSTPLGKKTIERMPAIMAESMAAGQVWGEQIARRAIEKLNAAGLQPST